MIPPAATIQIDRDVERNDAESLCNDFMHLRMQLKPYQDRRALERSIRCLARAGVAELRSSDRPLMRPH